MPVSRTELPILAHFISVVQNSTGMPLQPGNAAPRNENNPTGITPNPSFSIPKQLPKGVVLDKDGKPCRSCTSFASWAAMAKGPNPSTLTQSQAADVAPVTLPPGCPPDVEVLGRNTWTFLHTLTATYPSRPTPTQQQQTKSFISLFSNMYPCSHCADDFRDWMKEKGNGPRVESRDEFGRWMCEAHNAVNEKLGKEQFDCGKWEERWRTGPDDGRCG